MLGATRLRCGTLRHELLRQHDSASRTIRTSWLTPRTPKHSPPMRTSMRRSSNTAKATEKSVVENVVPEPNFQALRMIAFTQAIPFIGFGFMDNAILIVAGDAIDQSLGVMLGISTMCAAAIGNIISDVAGIMMGTVIEDFCANKLMLPVPDLTTAQRQLRSVRLAGQFGCAAGMVLGCIIGMFPLLFIDSNKIQALKREAQLESIFRDVVTEAKTLIGAESTCLWLRVSKQTDQENEKGSQFKPSTSATLRFLSSDIPLVPSANGDFLYAMYYGLPSVGSAITMGRRLTKASPAPPSKAVINAAGTSDSVPDTYAYEDIDDDDDSRLLSLGRGIVSRAAMTAQPWNIIDVNAEPDYLPNGGALGKKMKSTVKNMVCIPVMDSSGRAIAVIQAMNKQVPKENEGGIVSASISSGSLSPGEALSSVTTTQPGFTDQDVQILMALASHISVSLQSIYRDHDGDAELRIRDTIRILREHGMAGLATGADTDASPQQRLIQNQMGPRSPRALFPE